MFPKFFLLIGQNYQGRKYAHVFPRGRENTVNFTTVEQIWIFRKSEISTCADPIYMQRSLICRLDKLITLIISLISAQVLFTKHI